MKKFFAILLAVLMTASLSVVGMAEEGIQTYGGGGDDIISGIYCLRPELDTSKVYHTAEEFVEVINQYRLPNVLRVGETAQIALYEVTDNWGSDQSGTRNITIVPYTQKVTWTSDDTSILTVSNTGLITAVGTGSWKEGAALGTISSTGSLYLHLSFHVLATDFVLDKTYEDCLFGVLPENSESNAPLGGIGSAPTMRIGDTVQLALFYKEGTYDSNSSTTNQRYSGEVRWAIREMDIEDGLISISDTGLLTVRAGKGRPGSTTLAAVYAIAPGAVNPQGSMYYFVKVLNEQGDNPVPPTGGGSTGGGSSDDHDTPPATENAANDGKTLDKLAAGESAEVKLTSGSAALATDTMDTLGSHGGKLTVTVDKMTVAIPGGFGKVNEPGRIYYPLDFSDSLATAADLAAAVKGEKAKTEVVKAGGDMVMPTTVTVTLKTKLTGTVNVYHYNDTTRRYTLLASPAAKDGKITFATKQMGTMVLTTGTI